MTREKSAVYDENILINYLQPGVLGVLEDDVSNFGLVGDWGVLQFSHTPSMRKCAINDDDDVAFFPILLYFCSYLDNMSDIFSII